MVLGMVGPPSGGAHTPRGTGKFRPGAIVIPICSVSDINRPRRGRYARVARCAAKCSGAGTTLRRRPQSTRKPGTLARIHGVARYDIGVNATALLAVEGSGVEAARRCFEFRKQHAIVPARRATRPLDGGNMRRRYRLKFGHGAPRRFEGLAGLLKPKRPTGYDRTMNFLVWRAVFTIAHF